MIPSIYKYISNSKYSVVQKGHVAPLTGYTHGHCLDVGRPGQIVQQLNYIITMQWFTCSEPFRRDLYISKSCWDTAEWHNHHNEVICQGSKPDRLLTYVGNLAYDIFCMTSLKPSRCMKVGSPLATVYILKSV